MMTPESALKMAENELSVSQAGGTEQQMIHAIRGIGYAFLALAIANVPSEQEERG